MCDLDTGENYPCFTNSEFCRIFGDCHLDRMPIEDRMPDKDDCFFLKTENIDDELYSVLDSPVSDPRKSKINSFIDKRINRLWKESLKEEIVLTENREPRRYCLDIILLTPGFSEKIINHLNSIKEKLNIGIKRVLEETLKSRKSPNEIIEFLFENYNSVKYYVIFKQIVIYLRKYTEERNNNNFIDIIEDSADHIASMILNAPPLNDKVLEATYLK